MAGEHIRALRGGLWTHAIDCGDETVIHLANGAQGALCIRRSYRPEFVAGADAVEVVTHRERTFPAGEIVARAYSRIADPALAAMFRDSQAFADWCSTGRMPAAAPGAALGPSAAMPAPGRAAREARKARPARKSRARAKPSSGGKRAAHEKRRAASATRRLPAGKASRAKRSAGKKAARRAGKARRRR